MKLKRNLFALFILLSVFSFSVCQSQTVLEKYDKETIYLSTYHNYIKNGESYWIGFFGERLKKEMEVSPNAVIEYKKFSNKRNVSLALVGVGMAAMIGGLVNYDENDPNNGLLVGGYVSVLGGSIFALSSQRHRSKAIWIRNRDVLK